MTEQESTESLVRRAQTGDADAFGELATLYRVRLEALEKSRMAPALRRRMSPEEVVQETLTRGLEAIGRFEWRGDESVLRWLGAIVRNVIAAAARRDRVSPDLEVIRRQEGAEPSPSRRARREERFQRLEDALASLTPDQREIVLLSRVDGLKLREIAERTGRSLDAVKQLAVRGLRNLKREFGDTASLNLPDRRFAAGDGER